MAGKRKKAGQATAKKIARSAASGRRHHHSVYVIELSPEVLNEPRFRRANPDYDVTKPCVYVGMTGLTPERRLENHRKGIKSNRFAHEYGLQLLPKLYAFYNPMPYCPAQDMEIDLPTGLCEGGY